VRPQRVIIRRGANRSTQIETVLRFLRAQPADTEMRVTIELHREPRSSEANAYHWGVVVKMLADHTGYAPGDVHEWLCGEYWGWRVRKLPGGRRVSEPVRTTTHGEDGRRAVLGKAEFAAFVEHCQALGAQAGVLIPGPDDG